MKSSKKKAHWLRRLVATAVVIGFLPAATTACFGKFQLLRKVYDFNKEVSQDKWIQWFVFLILNFVPVYGIATFIDAIIANSLEFWTGENPIKADLGTRKVVHGLNGEAITMTLRKDGAIDVTLEGGPAGTRVLRVVREDAAVSAWDEAGNLLARVTDVDGQPAIVAGRGFAPAY